MSRLRTHPGLLLLRAGALLALAFSMALATEYYGGSSTYCGPGGGCEAVARSDIGRLIGDYLPALGLLAYTLVFVASLIRGRLPHRIAVYASLLGGVGGLFFLVLQGAVIGRWCPLCVGVDLSALLAAAGAGWLLASRPPEPRLAHGLLSPAWFFYWPLALGPVAWLLTFPDPDVPAAVRELWDPEADVTVVEMADFECPFCRALHPVLKEAVEQADADVAVARIMYPLDFHPRARNSARAYFCAEAQGRADAMADALFAAEDLSVEGNRAAADAIGLDLAAFDACVSAEATEERVREDLARGDRAGMEGLPTVWIGEQTFRGFLRGTGPERYVEAIEAAASGEGRRIRIWPGMVISVLAFGSLLLASRRREPGEDPPGEPTETAAG